jgi:SAM-dependent methyltransferase
LTVFAGYSRYYDLLYRDKDYAGEARFVAELIGRHAQSAKQVLEIGCGTGAHAVEWAQMGFDILGVDRSEGMLEAADARRSSLEPDVAARLSFQEGDARTVRIGRKFDAVTSLFHVMSYQTTNVDIAAAFTTAREHLAPGGVFIFDCWYGPAVLRQWPSVTRKNLADEMTSVVRTAEPVMRPNENIVDVNYTVVVTDLLTSKTETLHETHHMRYLFTPEVELALSTAGMTLVDSRAWMTDDPPGFESWSACYVARA